MALSWVCLRNVEKLIYSEVRCKLNRVPLWPAVYSWNLSHSGKF